MQSVGIYIDIELENILKCEGSLCLPFAATIYVYFMERFGKIQAIWLNSEHCSAELFVSKVQTNPSVSIMTCN